jgi:hypothetical protein
MPEKTRLGWKWLIVINTGAYYDTELIIAVAEKITLEATHFQVLLRFLFILVT